MRKVTISLFLFAALSLCYTAAAQEADTLKNKINIGVNYLSHGEDCSGGLPSSKTEVVEDYSNFVMGRFRMTVGYERDWLEMRGVIQNSAVWGMAGNMSLGLYEGWVKMKGAWGGFAQIGRVALAYDDERIIGPNDFAMAALSHDVLLLGYEGYGHKLHAILAYNQDADNVYANTYYVNGAKAYKNMQTVWYHYDVPKFPLGASLLFMNVGMQAGVQGDAKNPPHNEYQQLFGGYIKFAPEILTLEGSYYRQRGNDVNATSMHSIPIDAWMASVKATVKPSKYFGFNAGYDHLSGDDYVPVPKPGTLGLPLHSVDKSFTPLYGSHTKFYGMMDYFYESAYINGFSPGLQNAFAGVYGNPLKGLTCSATYHYLAVATDLTGLERTLGHSIELEASYAFTDYLALSVGYTQMAGTKTMARLKQTDESEYLRWAWFSLVITPTMFSTKF